MTSSVAHPARYTCGSCGSVDPDLIPTPERTVYLDSDPSKALPAHERKNVQTHVAELRAYAEAVDQTVTHLRAVIEALAEKRALIKAALTSHVAILVPVHQLPDELLCEIFLLCRSTLPEALFQFRHIERNEMTLTMVCQRWRQVALSLPQLWASLSICGEKKDSVVGGLTALRKLWIPRSAASPLDINFRGWRDYKAEYRHEFVEIITAESRRWRNVFLEIDRTAYGHLRDTLGCVEVLQSFQLHMYLSDRDPEPESALDLTDSVLNHLDIGRLTVRFVVGPWALLTNLTCGIRSWRDYYNVMRQTHALREHTVYLHGGRVNVDSTSMLIFSNMTHLSVFWREERHRILMENYLTAVHLPSLRHLQLRGWSWSPSALPRHLSRYGCSLVHLRLIDGDLQAEDLIQCLRQMASLEELSLVHSRISPAWSDVFSALRCRADASEDAHGTVILPNLREFELQLEQYHLGPNDDKNVKKSLNNFIESRLYPMGSTPPTELIADFQVSRLCKVDFELPGKYFKGVSQQLSRWKKERGLEFTFFYTAEWQRSESTV